MIIESIEVEWEKTHVRNKKERIYWEGITKKMLEKYNKTKKRVP